MDSVVLIATSELIHTITYNRVTHICVSKLLQLMAWRQAIILSSAF